MGSVLNTTTQPQIKVLGEIEGLSVSSKGELNQKILDLILQNRKVNDKQTFLNPPEVTKSVLADLQSLFKEELDKAVSLICEAVESGRPIFIHGDYDVDGISAAAILWETIYYELDYKKVRPFIPHRVEHGYGISVESIDSILADSKPPSQASASGRTGEVRDPKETRPLLITVDCGITSRKAIEYAKDLGFEVIVTDHHTKPDKEAELPDCEAILHTYELCGAGISWVLAQTLVLAHMETHTQSEDNGPPQKDKLLKKGLDLVALATIADIQKLTGYNRVVVKRGLKELSDTSRKGLGELYKLAGIGRSGSTADEVGTYEVGWIIAPRLNATGRLAHALDALRLLVARNSRQASEIALKLEGLNRKRQNMTFEAFDQAIEIVERNWSVGKPIVVAHPQWHEGIIGLIAARLAGKYKVPSVAIAMNEQIAKGSARSVEGVNVVSLLRKFEEYLESVGGHEMAAGFSLELEKLDKFSYKLGEVDLTEQLGDAAVAAVKVDLELGFKHLSWELAHELEKLYPFGVGNPRPKFLTRGLPVVDYRLVGEKSNHLSLKFPDGLRGIAFDMQDKEPYVRENDTVDLVYTLEKDDYRGGRNIQLKVKEIF